ncbi:cytokine receptor family member b1 isoform X2 [Parambassis ranga]|uniref:Cytokine receptor family member b1 isoform X2 n=1 Tax=Parambassis ranga TaxID=210632 RepID=A0A6P7H339_9TELE|nr:uncharacterized protein LOC114425977 isoform X2 [Parambassis ranga]
MDGAALYVLKYLNPPPLLRVDGKTYKHLQNSTTSTSCKLKLKRNRKYLLSVQASYNQTLSPESLRISFQPFTQTKLGPPKLSLAGCGNCILVNISPPEPQSDILAFYTPDFKVLWRKEIKGGKPMVFSQENKNKSFTLSNLERGVRYCVQVQMKINVNPHSEPSAWECAVTSQVEPRKGPVALGALAVVLTFLFMIVSIGSIGLYYTGFLCRLKAAVPRALMTALNQGYTLTPEKMILDRIYIKSMSAKEKKHDNPSPSVSGETGELESDDGDDNENNEYLERDAKLFRGSGPRQDSGYMSGNGKATLLEDSQRLTVKLSAKMEALYTEIEQDGANAEEAEFSFSHKVDQTDVQEQEEEEEKQAIPTNVNLFSVILSALAESNEE